jgi:hypothetical protein
MDIGSQSIAIRCALNESIFMQKLLLRTQAFLRKKQLAKKFVYLRKKKPK